MFNVVNGCMVDALEWKTWFQDFQECLLAGNVKGILERQWSRKNKYVMSWKQWETLHILVTG